MSTITLLLFIACPLLAFAAGGILFHRRRYPFAMVAVMLGIIAAAVGGINGFHEMKAQVVSEYNQELDAEHKAALVKSYRQAVDILKEASFSKPDQEKLSKAIALLRDFESARIASEMESDCPDTDALLTYARAMRQVSTYDGHMTNLNVNENGELQELAASLPDDYHGVLAEKILPFKRLIVGMENEAKKQAKLDEENAATHKKSMEEGKYGNLRPGDVEEKITAAMGKPDHINFSTTADGNIKQYVFYHSGKTFYVYTKNGVVTEIR